MSDEIAAAVESARAYEALHVPALFHQWAHPVLDAAGVESGWHVLDVACGTGVLARAAKARVGATGTVAGLDIDPGMLAVALEIEPGVEWKQGDAGDLPFADDRFDAVLSQFGLMFFPDRQRAIREMLRCTTREGVVVAAVWDSLERWGPFPITVDLLQRLAGTEAADALRAPFVLGDQDELEALFARSGASSVSVVRHVATARFPNIRTMFEADLRGWLPLMGIHLEESLIETLLAEAEKDLQSYVAQSGEVVFDAPAHIVVAAHRP